MDERREKEIRDLLFEAAEERLDKIDKSLLVSVSTATSILSHMAAHMALEYVTKMNIGLYKDNAFEHMRIMIHHYQRLYLKNNASNTAKDQIDE